MQFAASIGKRDKSRRSDSNLCQVLNSNAITRRRCSFEIHRFEESIHLSRRDTLASFLRDALYGGEYAIDVLPAGGGDEQNRSVAQIFQRRAELLFEQRLVCGWFAVIPGWPN